MVAGGYTFEWHPYQRPFKQPLTTHHGTWSVREGILITLTGGDGHRAQGEIAPLPAFGSETLAEAIRFCQQLPTVLMPADLAAIPDALPVCQFGFGCAGEQLGLFSTGAPAVLPQASLAYCGLLPTGEAALEVWPALWERGYRTLKWKIGVQSLEVELEQFHRLIQRLPASALLRLDANGGLTLGETEAWLAACDPVSSIEYLEQPVAEWSALLPLQGQYRTPMALDESVASLAQLQDCYHRGWRGIFTIKAAIMGYPHRLRQFCLSHHLDVVFSSVFETEVGRQACLGLAQLLSNPSRALGFGVDHWFDD